MANYFYKGPDGEAVPVPKTARVYCSTGEAIEQRPGHLYLVGPDYPMPEIHDELGPVEIAHTKRHQGKVMSIKEFEELLR